MNKAILFLALCAPMATLAQTGAVMDTSAIMILDHMARNIGELHACSFHLATSHDAMNADLGVQVKELNEHDVHMVGPDLMLVDSRGDKGHRGYWYDGYEVIYYSYTENNYGRMPAPPTIMEAIDSLHRGYGVDFPAADFFYPTFTDDLIAQSDRIAFVNTVRVGDVECFHIVATGLAQDMELWISNDATFRPVKYVIRDKGKNVTTEAEGVFSNWRINPDLPGSMFSFLPPPSAHEVRILPRNK